MEGSCRKRLCTFTGVSSHLLQSHVRSMPRCLHNHRSLDVPGGELRCPSQVDNTTTNRVPYFPIARHFKIKHETLLIRTRHGVQRRQNIHQLHRNLHCVPNLVPPESSIRWNNLVMHWTVKYPFTPHIIQERIRCPKLILQERIRLSLRMV